MLYPPYGAKLDASATKQMRGVAEGAASSEALPASEKRISVFGFSGATAKPQNLPTEPDIVVGARVRVQEGVTPSLGWGGVTRDSIGTVVAVRAPAFDEGDVEVKLDLKVKQTLTRCVFHCPGVGRG